ncbi:Icy1p [Saccharomyces cerevisiae YJM451]|nr:Icy1p [Saccharomyces cerevisiae YJM451]AJS78237.1 Icy1p [Saccharomyces cerevisiae YJM1199]
MSSNYATPLDDEVFPLSFANHQFTEHVSLGEHYSLNTSEDAKYNLNGPFVVPRDTGKFDLNTSSASDETVFSLDNPQENNYKHQAMNNVQDCRMAVAAKTTQSCDKLTDLYANAAQQNYRLWLSSF